MLKKQGFQLQSFQRKTNPPKRGIVIPAPSAQIGQYWIDYSKMVGSGNYSTVYMTTWAPHPEIPLVVKVINKWKLKHDKVQELLKGQIEVLKSIFHENLIKIKQIFQDQFWCYIITEYCEGGNVENYIKKNGLFSEQAALNVIKHTLEGLIYLEQNKIIHRDLKAANIFIRNGRYVVADFGFAKFLKHPYKDQLNIGSLPYEPPEVIKDCFYSDKGDVWAFGIFIFQILHGQSPYYHSHNYQELLQNVYKPLPLSIFRSQLSIALKSLILTCLQIDLNARPYFRDLKNFWFYKELFPSPNNFMEKKQIPQTTISQLTKNQVLEKEKTPFKRILIDIQQSRNIYKISKLLNDNERKFEIIKDHFLLSSYIEFQNIGNKIKNGYIHFGSSVNEENFKKNKIQKIIEEYKKDAKEEIIKRRLNVPKSQKLLIIQNALSQKIQNQLKEVEKKQLQIQSESKQVDSSQNKIMSDKNILSILNQIKKLKKQKGKQGQRK